MQLVRKLSGFNVPSKTNEAAFERAVDAVDSTAHNPIQMLATKSGVDHGKVNPEFLLVAGPWADLTLLPSEFRDELRTGCCMLSCEQSNPHAGEMGNLWNI